MSSFAIIFVSIIDLPTLITIVGSLWIKSCRKLVLLALVAALVGESIAAITLPTYSMMDFIIPRFVGQLIVAFCIFGVKAMKNKVMKLGIILIFFTALLTGVYMMVSEMRYNESHQFLNKSS